MPDSTFIGVDVQAARDCPYLVLDSSGTEIDSGWLPIDSCLEDAVAEVCGAFPEASVGLDCPRVPLQSPRQWYWKRDKWMPRDGEKGAGRHCEVVLKALNIANPQWTPLEADAPEWMKIGFRLFRAFGGQKQRVYEVFPSASYRLLMNAPDVKATLSFHNYFPGPKDMLDAAVGALTVREFESGRGFEVDGGDGLGTILLPRPPTTPLSLVLEWPVQSDV